MRVLIHQPDFLPWLGFFHRWAHCDHFIILDDVQFLRRGWHHRDRIKTASGPAWLTVPVIKKGRYEQEIREVEIDNSRNWRSKHLRGIETAYRKAPYFERHYEALKKIYSKMHGLLIDLNMDLLLYMARSFNIHKPLEYASRYNIGTTSTDRLVKLVECAGGDEYLTGLGSQDYLDESAFEKAGINVQWQNFKHPVYEQLHGAFAPGLSAVDYLMMNDSPGVLNT